MKRFVFEFLELHDLPEETKYRLCYPNKSIDVADIDLLKNLDIDMKMVK